QVGAWPAEAQRVEAARRHLAGPDAQPLDVCPPGRGGGVLVEADGVRHGAPQALDVRLAEDRLGPAWARAAEEAPREAAGAHRLGPGALAPGERTDTREVEVVEQRRLWFAED